MTMSDKRYPVTNLDVLQAEFISNLPVVLSEISELWNILSKNNNDKKSLNKIRELLSGLADAGGTYGSDKVSFLARKIDLKFKHLLDNTSSSLVIDKSKDNLNDYFIQLKKEAEEWLRSGVQKIGKRQENHPQTENKLVYTLLGDDVFLAEFTEYMERDSYVIQDFEQLNCIEEACKENIPAVIIVDEYFTENTISGIGAVAQLKNKIASSISIVYISACSDIECRLAATRAGATCYFYKPVKMDKVVKTIKSLSPHLDDLAYRVMIIDNDISILNCYKAILTEYNMVVETVSEPLTSFDAIEKFLPDIILLDMYMPECSGDELVHMIRQDERWSLIPIIFLSGEQDINNQLEAMSLGADDFLVKPVKAKKLVSSVNIAAKRARKNVKLNRELKYSLLENKYQLVTLDQHAIVSVADVAGRIIHINDKLCEISGYSREELLGKNHRILKSNYHNDAFYENMWSTIANGNIWHDVICNTTKNGSEYWVDSTIVPFINDKGKPYKYVSIRTDVTDIRVSEQRLHRSQDFANIGTWDWNILTGELFWSDRIWSLFCYKKEVTKTTYDNFLAAIHPDDVSYVTEAVNNCVEHGVEYDIEHRVIWPDGSVHWIHESGDVVRNLYGKAIQMLGVVQDITELKEAYIRQQANNDVLEKVAKGDLLEEILHSIVLHAEEIVADSTCSIFLLDDSGSCIEHAVAPNLPTYYKDAVKGLEIGMGVLSCGEAAFTGKKVIVSDIMTNKNWCNFKGLAEKAGIHACWSQPFLSSSGNVLGTLAFYFKYPKSPSDKELNIISELTQLANIAIERSLFDETLMQAKVEADNANRAKSQFLSSMSHELRTPMNAIIGFSQLLKISKEPPLTETQNKNVDEIIVAAEHLMSLINEVLDLAKIESGMIELTTNKVVLSNVVLDSFHLVSPLAIKRGIELVFFKDGVELSLEEIEKQNDTAWVDETRLKQVILNLLSNAIKYNKERGKVTLNCDYIDNDYLRISVTDTGEGISDEQKEHLFKAFERLDVDQSKIEGTGIGLVITKKIIELMGGHIGVDSEVGRGSTFWIELPVNSEKHKKINSSSVNNVSQELSNTGINTVQNKQKKSVLYIEDNPANLRLVEQVLGNIPNLYMWGAPEPLLGIELAIEHLPDLILLDINLPGMNGFEVFEKLKRNDACRDIPVFAVSANAMPKDIKKAEDAGFDGYITKPINIQELIDVVKSNISDNDEADE